MPEFSKKTFLLIFNIPLFLPNHLPPRGMSFLLSVQSLWHQVPLIVQVILSHFGVVFIMITVHFRKSSHLILKASTQMEHYFPYSVSEEPIAQRS